MTISPCCGPAGSSAKLLDQRFLASGLSSGCLAGHTADLFERKPVSAVKTLSVSDISLPPSFGNEAAQAPLHGISFDLHRGEILGIYGLLGAGRTELVETIAGSRVATKGSLRTGQLHGMPGSVTDAMSAGIVLVPEDRQRDGLVPELSIRENVVLAAAGFFLHERGDGASRQLATGLNIAARDLELPVTALSGGNHKGIAGPLPDALAVSSVDGRAYPRR